MSPTKATRRQPNPKDTPSLEALRAAVLQAREDSDIAWMAFFAHDLDAEPWDDVRADAHLAGEANAYYRNLEARAIAAGVELPW